MKRPLAAPTAGSDTGTLGFAHWLVFAGLLVAPNLALRRLEPALETQWILAAWLVLSVVTYVVYALDKRKARAQTTRTSEATLHVLSLIGGWPGAYLAQYRHRHKTAKAVFQFVFWLTVAAYQFAAIDCLLEWEISRSVVSRLTA